MKFRNLGKNGPRISEVGLGCWQFGNDWGMGIPEEKAMEIMETAVAQGMDLFDTADVYGNGRSEALIGAFLKSSFSVEKKSFHNLKSAPSSTISPKTRLKAGSF